MRFVNTKSFFLLGIMLILLWVIKNLIVSIFSLQQNSHIVTSLQQQENEAKRRNQFLKQQLYYVKTNDFIEQEAREKLGMVKPGEHIVLSPSIDSENPKNVSVSLPNWKKWWNLFF